MFDLESRPRRAEAATDPLQTRRESHSDPENQGISTNEWAVALHAADNALAAFTAATVHHGGIPTVGDRPNEDAPTRAIRDWVLDVHRRIARNPAGRILLANAPAASHSPTEVAEYLNRVADQIAALHELNMSSSQRGSQSWSLPSATAAVTPAWTSRRAWMAQVEHAVNTDAGHAACRANKTTPDTVLRHAAVYATHVDSATGRGLTASRKTLASQVGMSPKAEQRARNVLSALELIVTAAVGRTLTTVEHLAAALHHGTSQSRAASTLHLSTPRHLAHIRPAPSKRAKARISPAATRAKGRTKATAENPRSTPETAPTSSKNRDHLSLSGFSPEYFSLSDVTHQTRTRARRRDDAKMPRPLHLQRAAAQLLHEAPGLRGVTHIGSVCAVLESVGIDTTTWTGVDIARALDRDTQRRGWMWPAEITDPCALLAWRLRRISWAGTSPSENARRAAELREQRRAQALEDAAERDRNAASESARRAAIDAFRAAQASKKATTTPLVSAAQDATQKAPECTPAVDIRSIAQAELDAIRSHESVTLWTAVAS